MTTVGGTTPEAKLQLALDHVSLQAARSAAAQVAEYVDVIEVGTILATAEGVSAVNAMASDFPDHLVAADLRVVRAGRALADLAFGAGADWLSVMAGAPDDTISGVVAAAALCEGRVQAELDDDHSDAMFRRLADLGVDDAIVHRSAEAGATVLPWTARNLERLAAVAEAGLGVVVTGGITVHDPEVLANLSVSVFIVGRSIIAAADPRSEAARLRAAIAARHAP